MSTLLLRIGLGIVDSAPPKMPDPRLCGNRHCEISLDPRRPGITKERGFAGVEPCRQRPRWLEPSRPSRRATPLGRHDLELSHHHVLVVLQHVAMEWVD